MKLKLGGRLIVGAILVGTAIFAVNWWINRNGGKIVAPTIPGVSATAPAGQPVTAATAAPVKVASNELNVSLVSFHGYAPALVANGNSLTTQPGSIYDRLGVKVNLVIEDSVPTLAQTFGSGTSHCAWRTSDFWAQEQPNMRNAGFDGRGVMVVDNTQGADAIISKNPAIRTVEDLESKSVALLQFTPSHGMTIDALANSSLTPKKRASVKYVYINADEGTAGVRAALESGKVDAAVLWDPDLTLALKTGGHVVYSTKTAKNLIYDIIVCDSRVLAKPEGRDAVQKLVAGWMEGVKAARANPTGAAQALIATQKTFKQLAQDKGVPFIVSLFENLAWTGLEDNVRILGLAPGGTNHYERVYAQFDGIYRTAGALANPASPVIPAQNSFDYSFIKTLMDQQPSAVANAVDKTVFTPAGMAATTTASVTKPIIIKFETGSAELSAKAKATIDKEIVPFLENMGGAYVELSGNTDSTGVASVNQPLSLRRAQAVVVYLKTQWEIPAARLKAVGYGSERPLCVEPGTSDGLSLEDCRALNRSTRVGILQSR